MVIRILATPAGLGYRGWIGAPAIVIADSDSFSAGMPLIPEYMR